jgi:hypothetical protein
MSDEIAKAVQEVAKTSGQAIEAVRGFSGFIAEITKRPMIEAFGIVEDKLKYRRWKNQLSLMVKAQKLLAEKGVSQIPHPIPFKLAIPLLEGASLEDDNYLQDKWAHLLVNAVTAPAEQELRRVYIDILERLTPYEARILDKIYSLPYQVALHQAILTAGLPDHAEFPVHDPQPKGQPANPAIPSEEVCLALANLDRLDCISISRSWGGGQIFGSANQTLLGSRFLAACSARP